MLKEVNIASFQETLDTGASKIKYLTWYFISGLVFRHSFLPINKLKLLLLRSFGAKVGTGVVVKPCVNIKFPWKLQIGNYSWIGEHVWIDNLAAVSIGNNACISQGAYLLTGNHDFAVTTFDLITKGITIEDGCWIGAKTVVCPGVVCKTHSILTVGSIATKQLEPYGIYQGNPATKIKERVII